MTKKNLDGKKRERQITSFFAPKRFAQALSPCRANLPAKLQAESLSLDGNAALMGDPLADSINSESGEANSEPSTHMLQPRPVLAARALSRSSNAPVARQITTAAALVEPVAQAVSDGNASASVGNDEKDVWRDNRRKRARAGKADTVEPSFASESSSLPESDVHGNASRTDSTFSSRTMSLKDMASKNICHHLIQRSTFGSRRYLRFDCGPRPVLRWKPTNWIQFDDVDAQPLRFSSSKGHCRMAWDKLGILLAVSSDSVIRVYDWDMLRAADVRGRNLRASGQSGGAFAMEPILKFPVRDCSNSHRLCQVTVLTWNPRQPDELIVGTREGGVLVYDLGTELIRGVPSSRELWSTNDRISNHQSVSSIALVHDGELMIIGIESNVFCIHVTSRRRIWEWSTSRLGRATCIEHLPRTHLVLVGHSSGFMSILDYSKHQVKGFSCSSSPKILQSWLSHSDCGPTPQGSDMGIRHVQLESRDEAFRDEKAHVSIQLLSVTWVTSCGWVLRSRLDLSSPAPPCPTVLHATAPVKIENSKGDTVSQKPAIAEWSLPVDAHVAAAGSSSYLVWEAVPEVRRILPHSDFRVLDCKQRILRDLRNPALFVRMNFSYSGSIQFIKLPKRRNRPCALSVHPSNEWIVVAASDGIYTLTPRGCQT